MSFQSKGRKILFQLSGSIAAYKACFAISKLVQDGFELVDDRVDGLRPLL